MGTIIPFYLVEKQFNAVKYPMRLCPSYLSFILYNPVRKALTNRDAIMKESGITALSTVLEVGPGNGFLTEAMAKMARRVYAVEIQEGMVKKLKKRMAGLHDKVDIILADIASYDIGHEIADAAVMYYSLHEISNQRDAVINISRAVKQGGTLSIYEPTIEVSGDEMSRAVKLFEDAGFKREAGRDGLFTRSVRLRKTAGSNQ